MWGAAPRRRFALAAFLALAAIAFATPGAAAARAKLPAQLWAVQAPLGSAAPVAASVRGSGLNAMLVDGRRATPARLRAAARAARRNRLTLLVSASRAGTSAPAGRAALAACRKVRRTLPGAACAVTALTPGAASPLARRPGIDLVVVRLASPTLLASLRPSGRARLLALVQLRPASFDPQVWRDAVAEAGAAAGIDLAVAGNAAALRQFTPLLRERGPRSNPTPAPGPPGNLRVLEAAAASLTLGWSAPAGPRPAAYRLYLNGAGAGTAIAETMTLAGLRCATSYRVEVESVSASGAASSRAAVDARTAACGGGGGGGGGDTTKPSAPTNLTKTGSTPTSISLGWTASFDNVAVTGYQVYADGAAAGNAAGTSHTVSGLACGRSYSIGVEARDAAGNVSARATISASTSACPGGGGDTTAPSTPAGLSATSATASSIAVSWNASTDNVAVTGYGLYRNGASVTSTGSRTYTFTGLACGTSYSLAVDAYDAAGNRSGKASLSASTSACAPPPPGSGTVPVYTRDNPPATPALEDLPKQSSVTKDGITWTFSQAVPVGRFITGDYYVVGPVTVTAISPPPANGRNGSVKNIPPTVDETGFDSRTSSNRYEAALRSDPPVSLVPGDSLVSSISVDTVGATKRWLFDTTADSPVKSISILTSVAAPLPPDAFRPSYAGKSSPVFYSRNLRRDLLPKLAPVADTPSLADWEWHFRRPWVDNLFFNFDSPIDYMPDYSREIARAVSMGGLLLSLDYSTEAKEPLLVYLTQYGIDLYGLVQKGYPGWPAHGGHGNGRKLPIVLAGTLLEQPGMQKPNAKFGQDMQTVFGTGWTGATALYAGHYGTSGSGEYGAYEHLQPRDWLSSLGEDYRRCCTSMAWVGEALVARLVPGVMAAWNHPPFFAYADRWMTEDDSGFRATIVAQGGKNYNSFPQRKAWDRFVTNMWTAYR